MNQTAGTALAILSGYLLGSISFSILLSRLKYQDDIRRHGSGNAGMTNTLRTYGKLSAVIVLAGDFGKGFLAAWLGWRLGGAAGAFAAYGSGFVRGNFLLLLLAHVVGLVFFVFLLP